MTLPRKKLVNRNVLEDFYKKLSVLDHFYKDQKIKNQLLDLAERCQDAGIKDELSMLSLQYQDPDYKGLISELTQHFYEQVYNPNEDTKTAFKQFVYMGMKATDPGSEANKFYYDLYQSVKSGDFTLDDMIEFFDTSKL